MNALPEDFLAIIAALQLLVRTEAPDWRVVASSVRVDYDLHLILRKKPGRYSAISKSIECVKRLAMACLSYGLFMRIVTQIVSSLSRESERIHRHEYFYELFCMTWILLVHVEHLQSALVARGVGHPVLGTKQLRNCMIFDQYSGKWCVLSLRVMSEGDEKP